MPKNSIFSGFDLYQSYVEGSKEIIFFRFYPQSLAPEYNFTGS